MNETNLILLLLIAFAISSLIVKLTKPRIKGKIGEAKVAFILRRLGSRRYKVINNLLIRSKSGSSQIDHVIISPYGVFVIETKNYKGWIFGHESADDWTQTLFRKKYKFRNPILQCWGHIRTLKAALPEYLHVPYFPIIVFTGSAKLKKSNPKFLFSDPIN